MGFLRTLVSPLSLDSLSFSWGVNVILPLNRICLLISMVALKLILSLLVIYDLIVSLRVCVLGGGRCVCVSCLELVLFFSFVFASWIVSFCYV